MPDRVLVRFSVLTSNAVLAPAARRRANARFVDGQSLEWARLGVHRAVEIHDRDERQVVPLADLEVVRIMRRASP